MYWAKNYHQANTKVEKTHKERKKKKKDSNNNQSAGHQQVEILSLEISTSMLDCLWNMARLISSSWFNTSCLQLGGASRSVWHTTLGWNSVQTLS